MTTLTFADARIDVPDDWEVAQSTRERVLLALEPLKTNAGFRANLVLGSSEPVDYDVAEGEELRRDIFPMYQLLDIEECTVAGRPGMRRLATSVAEGPTPVTTEQWLVDGYHLTLTVDTWRYPTFTERFEAIAQTLRVPQSPEASMP